MAILVTGAAGFIGAAVSNCLLSRGDSVVGIDNLSNYYDVGLKQARLERLSVFDRFSFERIDVANRGAMAEFFELHRPQKVIHLAAQVGVRYSISHPHAYIDSNIQGFTNILEGCRQAKVAHLVYASSSSVYGANRELSFSVDQNVGHPVSLYAATKKANELMAHCYSHLYRLPTTGLRFFTVYGPWARPDMAFSIFSRNILDGKTIDVFNFGKHRRDFTYIDDIVEAVVRVLDKPAAPDPGWDPKRPDPATSSAPYRLYNIGSNLRFGSMRSSRHWKRRWARRRSGTYCLSSPAMCWRRTLTSLR
jgi:UDP-glucuronate 4-epimerase